MGQPQTATPTVVPTEVLCHELRAKAIECLQESQEAAEILATILEIKLEQPPAYASIIDKLIEGSTADRSAIIVLQAYRKCLERHKNRNTQSVTKTAELFHFLLPIVYTPQELAEIRQSIVEGQTFIRLRAKTQTIAEIVMARVDSRPARFQIPSAMGGIPKGRHEFPAPPESGMDSNGTQYVEDFKTQLGNEIRKMGFPTDAEKPTNEEVSDALENNRLVNKYRLYCFYTVPTDEGLKQRRRAIMQSLHAEYSGMVFLETTELGDRRLEKNIVHSVSMMLQNIAGHE